MGLAQMLNHTIQHDDKKITLRNEIEFINRYVNLQKLRLQIHTQIDFEHTSKHDYVTIQPLMLIPFVENAFMYGVNSHGPTYIKITINVVDDFLIHTCQNTLIL